MEITAFKCDKCGTLIEDLATYEKHMEIHRVLDLFEGAFPEVHDPGLMFANGHWCVQRDRGWLQRYKDRLLEIIPPSQYEPFGYGWFRSLDDGGSPFYKVACRVLNVCPTCFREWGQGYYANHCSHDAERNTVPEPG